MYTYSQAVAEIIKEQQSVIGSLAFDQAKRVHGLLLVSETPLKLTITEDGKIVLGELVKQYSQIFGQASVEVCKEARKHLKPPPSRDDLPEILR